MILKLTEAPYVAICRLEFYFCSIKWWKFLLLCWVVANIEWRNFAIYSGFVSLLSNTYVRIRLNSYLNMDYRPTYKFMISALKFSFRLIECNMDLDIDFYCKVRGNLHKRNILVYLHSLLYVVQMWPTLIIGLE